MTRESLHIRPATRDDADTLIEFNRAMALETEHRRLDLPKLREGVLGLFTKPEYGFYTVAEVPDADAHRVIGQLLITFEWSDWRDGVFWWIQSVYVVPERRGMGVFRAMYNHILAKAKADSRVCGIRLYVERENRRAQTTYQRVGLTPSGYTVFEQDFVLGHKTVRK